MEGEQIVLVGERHAAPTITLRDVVAIPFRQKRTLLISFVSLFALVKLEQVLPLPFESRESILSAKIIVW